MHPCVRQGGKSVGKHLFSSQARFFAQPLLMPSAHALAHALSASKPHLCSDVSRDEDVCRAAPELRNGPLLGLQQRFVLREVGPHGGNACMNELGARAGLASSRVDRR